ncbi:hypothetical protein PoB_002249400 [Plakobranchus ocellatus]|uniref:Uncharacterized protein n=1 Tax=Plakobranchus ocellatus TaxID=259542 RepID=A0AAV3ZNN0_9GAST|nr:hypothetical protein PoB_002249400 [Plakobranchus ocellatus]
MRIRISTTLTQICVLVVPPADELLLQVQVLIPDLIVLSTHSAPELKIKYQGYSWPSLTVLPTDNHCLQSQQHTRNFSVSVTMTLQ